MLHKYEALITLVFSFSRLVSLQVVDCGQDCLFHVFDEDRHV